VDQPTIPATSPARDVPTPSPPSLLPERSAPMVVGIGASAGGLEALEDFFDSVPDQTGMAFVVVQHLSPDFKSLMDELLARHTALPIHLAANEMPVEADHVYLIPPRMEMIISGGRLLLSERGPQPELNLPIDTFFRSLARDCGERAIGIVLSGGGSDGSRGIRDIREAGGLVLVQDTETAQFDGMPKTAREAGVAHWVLAPQEMPHVLLEHVREHKRDGRGAGGPGRPPESSGIEAVYQMLEERFGIDFTHYKPSTITRRIERRLALAQSPHVDEYVQRLRSDSDELDVLYRDLLIGVTHFFRDEHAFRILEEQVLPQMLERVPRDEPIRVWVAGCATGEEAYSLAIALQDAILKSGVDRTVKIFATDVHRGSLDRAARAIYEREALAHVSPERLERYFIRIGDAYQVAPDLRKMIVFAQHNVMRDAPFTRVDLVTCRNLLIYLQPAAQLKVLSLFHFALKRGGHLFLGPSETVGTLAHEFDVVDKRWRLYQKSADVRRVIDNVRRPAHFEPRHVQAPLALPPRQSLMQLLGTYDAILDDLMPPSLLVSERGELAHAFAGASRFLRVRDGRQDLDLTDMVDAELRLVLVGGIKRALEEPDPLVFRSVRQVIEGESHLYDVTIRRVRNRTNGARYVLISFEEVSGVARPTPRPATEVHLEEVSRDQVSGLEAELSHTKENLQSAIEELETSNEELQAANEELQASNEELQSTNEELQSVNEELYTVNAEYQRKISELTELTNDMDNLLASTEVGTVFLDRQLRIRKFTPQIAETFALVAHDVGRPIETFASKLDRPELVGELRGVLTSGRPVEREIRDGRGKTFFLRIFPYRAKGAVDGVVLTLIDASGLRAAEDALFHERHLLESLLANLPEAIYFKDGSGKFIRSNAAMAMRLGAASPGELAGKTPGELPHAELAEAMHKQDETVLRTGEAQTYSLERRGDAGDDSWDLVTRLPIRDPEGRIVGTTGIFRDVTDQKRAEEENREAVRRRDQFLAMLSHELRNPLSAIVSATSLLREAPQKPEKRGRFLDVLSRQTQQMSRLLDELLEASRVTQNKIELRKEPLDLNDVVRAAVDAARGQIDARGLELTVEVAPEPLPVDGDTARLEQILANLLSNAAKYTPAGGHVAVTTALRDGRAEIQVKDDGAGIPPELLRSVFELFVQSRRTLDRAAGGLGVGLSLVRALVEMHGGTVTAHSPGEGKGSTFVVSLPLSSGAPALGEGDDGHTAGRNHDDVASDRPCAVPVDGNVLIVEDNQDSREMLCEMLTLSGLNCGAADSGPAALSMLDELRPHSAIIDLGLPGIDGLELARRIRSLPGHADMCLVALTGYGQPADRALAKAAGFDAHLVKPVRVEQLIAALTDARNQRQVLALATSA
jgi:two-component system, chemotaxis family, CheB/CheR fusion protein